MTTIGGGAGATASDGVVGAEFNALGTGVRLLVTQADSLGRVREAVQRELDAIEGACSRFREDSELSRLNAAAGREVAIGPLLSEALAAALRAARATAGAVDPTVGGSMLRIGYDRDFASVDREGEPIHLVAERVPGWEVVELDVERRRARAPQGVQLDLGATAKALAADRAARSALGTTEGGVLVSLGGDIATSGPPPRGGWRVLVTDDHAAPLDAPGQVVSLTDGGLATSSTTVRRWERGRVVLHHIIDPATGLPAASCWRTVAVLAATCVDANAAATASIIWGERAPEWLERHRLPARLVALDGRVVRVAGWPDDEPPAVPRRAAGHL
jgi:thiamine biosynthesis lipoprotein